MGRISYRLALLVVGLYLYSQGTGFWVLCALALVWSLLQQQIAAIVGVLGKLANVPHEHDANSVLIYTFGLEKVFEHASVDALFSKLQKNGAAPAASVEAWRQLLLESYARKYAPATVACEVRFNIKNNLLFRNGEVDFGDHIYHELEIPYHWATEGQPERKRLLSSDCGTELSVRVLVVNGTLQLQVGRFNKEYTPKILHSGGLDVYETFATITSFPLMYFSHQHGIPVRYLNLVAAATPSYKASHDDRTDKKKSKGMYTDWQTLNREIAAYRVLCDEDNPNYNYDRIKKLSQVFEEKREKLLAVDGYTTYSHADEESWRYPDTGHTYWNTYGQVFFQNMNANQDSRWEERWFTDYYEEQP